MVNFSRKYILHCYVCSLNCNTTLLILGCFKISKLFSKLASSEPFLILKLVFLPCLFYFIPLSYSFCLLLTTSPIFQVILILIWPLRMWLPLLSFHFPTKFHLLCEWLFFLVVLVIDKKCYMRLGSGPRLWKITAWSQRYSDFTDSHSLGSISIQLHMVNNSSYTPNCISFRYSGNTEQKWSLAKILVPFIYLPYYIGHMKIK